MDAGLKVKINEPQHEISNNMVCVISKDSDKPARIGSDQPARIGSDLDWLQSLKQYFIIVSYHILVASLTLMALC